MAGLFDVAQLGVEITARDNASEPLRRVGTTIGDASSRLDDFYRKFQDPFEPTALNSISKDFGDLGALLGRFPRAVEFSFDRLTGNLLELQTKFDLDEFRSKAAQGADALSASLDNLAARLKNEVETYAEGSKEREAANRGQIESLERFREAAKALRHESEEHEEVYQKAVKTYRSVAASIAATGQKYAAMTGVVETGVLVAEQASKAFGNLKDGASALSDSMRVDRRVGADLGDEYFSLRQAVERLGVVYGQTNDQVESTVSGMMRLSAETGVSIGTITQLESAFADTGMRLADFAESTQKRIAVLADTFGMAGERFAQFQSSAVFSVVPLEDGRHSMNAFIDTATRLTQEFQIPGLLENLAEVAGATQDAIDEFGNELVGTGMAAQETIQRSAATIAKAFNVTMRDAVSNSVAIFKGFTNELSQIEDVTLGLSDSFGGLAQALMENAPGMASFSQITGMIESARDDPVEFAKNIRDMAAAFGEGSIQGRRLIKAISREVPDAVRTLIMNPMALEGTLGTLRQIREANQEGLMGFEQFTQSYRSTFKELQSILDNLVEVSKLIIGDIFGKDFKEGFKPAIEILKGFNQSLVEFAASMKDPNSSYNRYMRPVFVGATKLTIGLGAAAGALVSVIGGVSAAFAGFASLPKLAKGFRFLVERIPNLVESMGKLGAGGGALGKIFGNVLSKNLLKVTKLFGTKVPVLNVVIGAISGIYTAVSEMTEVFGDPTATAADKFIGFLRGITKGVIDFLDATFLFGIGDLITDLFFPEIKDAFDRGFNELFGNFPAYAASAGELLGTGIRKGFIALWEGGSWLLSAIGSALEGISFSIANAFTLENLQGALSNIAGFFVSVGEVFTGYWKGFIAGITGTPVKIIEATIKNALARILAFLDNTLDRARQAWNTFKTYLPGGLAEDEAERLNAALEQQIKDRNSALEHQLKAEMDAAKASVEIEERKQKALLKAQQDALDEAKKQQEKITGEDLKKALRESRVFEEAAFKAEQALDAARQKAEKMRAEGVSEGIVMNMLRATQRGQVNILNNLRSAISQGASEAQLRQIAAGAPNVTTTAPPAPRAEEVKPQSAGPAPAQTTAIATPTTTARAARVNNQQNEVFAKELAAALKPGSSEVNITLKLDKSLIIKALRTKDNNLRTNVLGM